MMNTAVTSDDALQELAELERQLPAVSAALDAALVNGGDAESARADLDRGFRRRELLVRQADLLRKAEAKTQKTDAALAMRQADADVVRCQKDAADALAEFAPAFRERLAEIEEFAREHVGAHLQDLDAAVDRADEVHGRLPVQIMPAMNVAYGLERHYLSVLARLRLPEEQLAPFSADTIVLLALEAFLSATALVEH